MATVSKYRTKIATEEDRRFVDSILGYANLEVKEIRRAKFDPDTLRSYINNFDFPLTSKIAILVHSSLFHSISFETLYTSSCFVYYLFSEKLRDRVIILKDKDWGLWTYQSFPNPLKEDEEINISVSVDRCDDRSGKAKILVKVFYKFEIYIPEIIKVLRLI